MAFAETGVFVETEASAESLVKTETEASEAFAASWAFRETAASERGTRAAGLEAMFLLARPAESNNGANEAVLATRAS